MRSTRRLSAFRSAKLTEWKSLLDPVARSGGQASAEFTLMLSGSPGLAQCSRTVRKPHEDFSPLGGQKGASMGRNYMRNPSCSCFAY